MIATLAIGAMGGRNDDAAPANIHRQDHKVVVL
jgi:hypothetical protein